MTTRNQEARMVFLIHIMKTGGTSARFMMRKILPDDRTQHPCKLDYEALPKDEYSWVVPYISIGHLRKLSAERKRQIKFLSGHLPYCVGELFEQPIRYMSFFRDPVARTISHLKDSRTRQPGFIGMTIEQLYDNEDFFNKFVLNLQTRYFAHDLTDNLGLVFEPKELTLDDVRRAKERIAQLEFIGLQEDFDTSIAMLKHQFNMPIGKVLTKRFEYEDCSVPDRLPERIAKDNAHDIELYEFVKDLYYERRQKFLQRAA